MFRRQLLIQRAHQRVELLGKRRTSGCGLAHFAPYLLHFGERDIFSSYVTVQDGLIERIAGLEHNVVHLLIKGRVADQRKDEIIEILHAMVLRHRDDFVLVECGQDGCYRRFRNWLGACRLRLLARLGHGRRRGQ